MNKIKIIIDKLEQIDNNIEKNIYITDLKYLFHQNFKDDIEKIVNQYKNIQIGEKRAAEISKKVAKIINKNTDIICVYRVPEGNYWGEYYNTTGKKYDSYNDIENNTVFIRAEKNTDYYNNERINVEISIKNNNITTLYYAKENNKYIYEINDWEKLRYTNIEDVPDLALKIKELYNNSILKIEELRKEIRKQEDNINNECIRGLINGCLYIYGDYKDKLLED